MNDPLGRALAYVQAATALNLDARAEGLCVEGRVTVAWTHLEDAAGEWPPDAPAIQIGRLLQQWLDARLALETVTPTDLHRRARVHAFGLDHPLYPGRTWTQERVHGDYLHLGIGLRCDRGPAHPLVLPVPPSCWASRGVDPTGWWPTLRVEHERAGELSALRHAADRDQPERLIRSVDAHDVVALLGTATLRTTLVEYARTSMVLVAVPTRHEGWVSGRLVDPAFAAVVADAADPAEIGFPTVVMVTRDEVVSPRRDAPPPAQATRTGE